MIGQYLVRTLKDELPKLTWTEAFYTANDNTGTVYTDGGRGVGRYESPLRFPTYQLLIRSSDWDMAETYAIKALELINKTSDVTTDVYLYENGKAIEKRTVNIMYLENRGGILNLGIDEDNIRSYSINFDATLNVLNKEEIK